MQYINTEISITEMGVSNEAKNVIPLKFLRKIKNKIFFSSCEPNPGTYGISNTEMSGEICYFSLYWYNNIFVTLPIF
jgi:hypothetical protein